MNLIISLLSNSFIIFLLGNIELGSLLLNINPKNCANNSANIFGIPSSSREKENLFVFLFLNLAIDVVIGPLLASTLSLVGLMTPSKSPLVVNCIPNLLLRESLFFERKRISVDPNEPEAITTVFDDIVFITLIGSFLLSLYLILYLNSGSGSFAAFSSMLITSHKGNMSIGIPFSIAP